MGNVCGQAGTVVGEGVNEHQKQSHDEGGQNGSASKGSHELPKSENPLDKAQLPPIKGGKMATCGVDPPQEFLGMRPKTCHPNSRSPRRLPKLSSHPSTKYEMKTGDDIFAEEDEGDNDIADDEASITEIGNKRPNQEQADNASLRPSVQTSPASTRSIKSPRIKDPGGVSGADHNNIEKSPRPKTAVKKDDPTPEKDDPTPEKDNPTPEKDDHTPEKDDPTPEKDDPTPEKDDHTPEKDDPTPETKNVPIKIEVPNSDLKESNDIIGKDDEVVKTPFQSRANSLMENEHEEVLRAVTPNTLAPPSRSASRLSKTGSQLSLRSNSHSRAASRASKNDSSQPKSAITAGETTSRAASRASSANSKKSKRLSPEIDGRKSVSPSPRDKREEVVEKQIVAEKAAVLGEDKEEDKENISNENKATSEESENNNENKSKQEESDKAEEEKEENNNENITHNAESDNIENNNKENGHINETGIDWSAVNAALPYEKTPEQKAQRKELWSQIDKNQNGYVDLKEITAGVRDVIAVEELYSCKPAVTRAFHFAKGVSKNKDRYGANNLEFREFRVFLQTLRQYFEYYQAFSKIDTGGDDMISKDEFMSDEAKELVEKWVGPIENMEEEFGKIDVNGGGKILFSEFINWALAKNLDIGDEDDE